MTTNNLLGACQTLGVDSENRPQPDQFLPPNSQAIGQEADKKWADCGRFAADEPKSDRLLALKVGFAGTPEFAAMALQALWDAHYAVALVLTQPDRPAGRGLKLQPSAVKTLALTRQVPVYQPRGLRLDGRYAEEAEQTQAILQAAQLDVLVVAAYGLILPQWVLDLPRLGCLNIHASLLPRWRGAAPIHRAIESGDAQTGITLMQMNAGLDTGDMLLVRSLGIPPQATTASLHDSLAALGGACLIEVLQQAQTGALKATPQPEQGVTYAHKIEKSEALISWTTQDAIEIERRIRAFDPFPGCHTSWRGEVLKIWQAQALDGQGEAGHIVAQDAHSFSVACRSGVLRIMQVQRAGGKRITAAQFLQNEPDLQGISLL